MRRRAILVGLAVSRVAAAQPTTAQADALFHQGRDLLAAGHTAEACAAFDASEKLQPDVATVLNQANCRAKNGQLSTAWGLFFDAERQLRGATGDEAAQRRHLAQSQLAALEPQLSSLAIVVGSPVAGLVVERDGAAIDPGILGRPLPIDGGSYTIVARAPGFRTWTTRVTVGTANDHQSVAVPALAPEPVAPSPPDPPRGITGDANDTTTDDHGGSPSRPPIVISAVAVALLGAGLGTELWAESTDHHANTLAMTDLAAGRSQWHDANTERHVSEGLLVAGVAGAGVAVWAWVASRHHDKVHTAMVPTGRGLALVRTW